MWSLDRDEPGAELRPSVSSPIRRIQIGLVFIESN